MSLPSTRPPMIALSYVSKRKWTGKFPYLGKSSRLQDIPHCVDPVRLLETVPIRRCYPHPNLYGHLPGHTMTETCHPRDCSGPSGRLHRSNMRPSGSSVQLVDPFDDVPAVRVLGEFANRLSPARLDAPASGLSSASVTL